MEKIRLQKYLAKSGIASRRKAEELIQQGKIKVNDDIITEMGYKVDPKKDQIYYKGKIVTIEDKKVYIILNKPKGYITTAKEQLNRPCVLDLLKDIDVRIYPVGRLDMDTSGLLLLTNDGDFAYKLTHPKNHIGKKYLATVWGIPGKERLKAFKEGIKIEEGYVTKPAEVKVVSKNRTRSTLEIVIYEGRNRQVRKMCEAIGNKVIDLKRISIGDLKLGNLEEGKYRELKESEIKNVLRSCMECK